MSLPEDYTVEMALKNNDILATSNADSYNTNRLRKFIYNFKRGIPDKVRITIFGIDGPPYISILESDGYNIKYTQDDSRISKKEVMDTVEGTDIYEITERNRTTGWLAHSFYITTEKYPLPIFGERI